VGKNAEFLMLKSRW